MKSLSVTSARSRARLALGEATAPCAPQFLSLVPGVGQGVAAAIGAALALAEDASTRGRVRGCALNPACV